jgi:hypothetical protein
VKAITEELCGHSFSAAAISAIHERLDASLAQFATRPLVEAFPYLILDARYERVREAGVIVSPKRLPPRVAGSCCRGARPSNCGKRKRRCARPLPRLRLTLPMSAVPMARPAYADGPRPSTRRTPPAHRVTGTGSSDPFPSSVKSVANPRCQAATRVINCAFRVCKRCTISSIRLCRNSGVHS